MEEFRRNALDRYVERTLEQFHQYFPGPSNVIGDGPLRQMIRLGVDRAAQHRIEGECNVVLYTTVMLLCGSFFDEDPQYPWAREILKQEHLVDEGQRAERLYDDFMAYWERVSSGDRSGLVRYAMHACKQPVAQFDEASSQQIIDHLRYAWSQKAAELGDAGVYAVLREAEHCAGRYRMFTRRDHAVLSCLVFALGNGFDRDPMYPWATEVLTSAHIAPADRGAQLYEAGKAYARRWLEFARPVD
jgi:hypothetical protein